MCEREACERGGCGLASAIRIRSSDTLRYINLTETVIGLVVCCGPIHLCVCVSKESGKGEGVGSQVLSLVSNTLTLTEVVIGLVR